MMTVADLSARVRRLEELTRGLAKEVTRWKDCNDPLLYLERRAYLAAMQNALADLDDARVVLAQARERLGIKASGGRQPPDPATTSGG